MEPHVSDQDLLRSADRELPARRIADIRTHLASCWTCRARMGELERAIAVFVQMNQRLRAVLPSPGGGRALLKLRMAELDAASAPNPWRRLFSPPLHWRGLTLACCIVVLAGTLAVRLFKPTDASPATLARLEALAVPDPGLTPGATLPVTRNDVCGDGMADAVRLVPASVARQVFAAYGIHEPRPRAYELDYLITPRLGGSDHIRNFWPQAYGATVWNAHIKDALEDRLYRLVCAGELDLATAQRDISQDWIAAYKKYFRTAKPLPEHVSFLQDRPWE